MAPGKDNMSASVSILTQRQLDKFVREYRIPLDLHPVLPSKDETIYPFRQGKFPFNTRVCNFVNYRVPFSRFFIRVLQFFRVHISQVNPFGLSRISHYEISCRAQDRRPDLNVFRYFYEFITAGDWYTFAHRKGIPPPSSDERSSLKNWKDNFFWLDDHCLPEDMRWRFKDQSMSFDLGEDFVFDQELARALIEHKSPIRPLHEHFLLLGRLCFSWSQGDRDWLVIRRKRDRVIMSLRDALKVPNFDVFDFDLEDQGEDEVPLMKQVGPSAQEIRPVVPQNTSEQAAAETTSSVPTPIKYTAGSSGSQAGKKSILDDVDSDPEIRNLYDALEYHPSSGSLKSKGIMHEVDPQALIHKRKTESVQIRSSDPLPMPRIKKMKKSSSHSGGDVMIKLDEHLTGGKFSREEAARARSEPTPAFTGGFLPTSEVESHDGPKAVTFSGTILDSSLGPDRFLDDEEDQVSFLPPSWFEPELMSFFRDADVFSDEMEIDPATAEEKFIPEWDIRNKDSVMDELVARTLIFNISTPLDHARSRRMKNQDLGVAVLTNQAQSNVFVTELYRRWVEAEFVRENLEKGVRSMKHKIQRTPETEKKIAQLTLDLQAQQEKIKSSTTQSQSSQAAAASAVEDRDRISVELKNFSESMQKKDEKHKTVLAKMEESFNNARLAYANMMAENAVLKASVDDLQVMKTWLLSEGARLLTKHIHKGPEMTAAVAALNNAMSVVGVKSGLHNSYFHALKKKTPYAEVPMLNRNAGEELNAAVTCFDSLIFSGGRRSSEVGK
ncbi:hypothetical protein HanRHA438_Chr17g0813271 [Helianthus annuus]|nr:hypothetical protein HanIR_Chr17g0871261 [Helianthus annuus]KAJ0447563.1 hypothetical protein HanHA89_Chr17g0706781 [Helianthus annuus]KAJ0632470.1 hypothetical protein HanLR1_Chr17g0665471 [Helianthus annuus]KAJ0826345.1 hypothetical protein HanRHA438_Chr17g0813271 [Helianthus annuus]